MNISAPVVLIAAAWSNKSISTLHYTHNDFIGICPVYDKIKIVDFKNKSWGKTHKLTQTTFESQNTENLNKIYHFLCKNN